MNISDEEFRKAVQRLPRPIAMDVNGATCPWCGDLHKTIVFGKNECRACGKSFLFGIPDWEPDGAAYSWVSFPWREFEALGGKADLLPIFQPNSVLQKIYFEQAEDRLGVWPDMSRAN